MAVKDPWCLKQRSQPLTILQSGTEKVDWGTSSSIVQKQYSVTGNARAGYPLLDSILTRSNKKMLVIKIGLTRLLLYDVWLAAANKHIFNFIIQTNEHKFQNIQIQSANGWEIRLKWKARFHSTLACVLLFVCCLFTFSSRVKNHLKLTTTLNET